MRGLVKVFEVGMRAGGGGRFWKGRAEGVESESRGEDKARGNGESHVC